MLDEMLRAVADEVRRRVRYVLEEAMATDGLGPPETVHDGEPTLDFLQTTLRQTLLQFQAGSEFVDRDRERHLVTRGAASEDRRPRARRSRAVAGPPDRKRATPEAQV